ncbi:glycosyltransferase family 25 protein [Parasedimentitalea huanghaiensis]
MTHTNPQQIPIYLINLDNSPERLKAFEAETSHFGLQFTRVSAVNSAEIPPDQADNLLSRRSGHLPLGKGEMGCFLSHQKVWDLIISGNDEWAFVAEDDIHISNPDAFFSDMSWLPEDADIVKAETARQLVTLSIQLHSTVDGHEIRQLQSYHGGSAGYFVSRTGAQKLLASTQDKCDALDHVLFHTWIGIVQTLKVYQMDPAICVQDYLLKGLQKKGFASTLNTDRSTSRSEQGMVGKPKGLAKLWREISRPFTRLLRKLSVAIDNARGVAVIKFIPFHGDSKR